MLWNLGKRLMVITLSIIMLLMSAAPVFASGDYIIRFSGHMSGTNGSKVYYAVGSAGGSLFSYDMETQTSKKLASGHWKWINVKGKYLYAVNDKLGLEDSSNNYIYRLGKNGKHKKKLAGGISPVVKGKYIYYIAVKKYKYNSFVEDTGEKLGIYRMKLNGKGKKRLIRVGSNSSLECLGVTSKSIVYLKNGRWYKCSLSGKGSKRINVGDYGSNLNASRRTDSGSYINDFSIIKGDYWYFPSGQKIARRYKINHGDIPIASVSGKIRKIIVSGKQLMAITENGNTGQCRVYIMNQNGSSNKCVRTVYGGWFWYY